MPASSKMTNEEIEQIQQLIGESLSDTEIAKRVGRHRTSVVKVRAGARRKSVTTGGKQLQVRLSDEEFDGFKAEADRLDLTLSEAGRRLVRHSLGVLDVDAAEIEALAGLRRELNIIGGDLNQMVNIAKTAPEALKDHDRSVLEALDLKVDGLVNQLIAAVGAGRRKTFVRAVFPVEGPISE